jgi:hypothetical protein
MLRTRLFLYLTPFVVILLAVGVYAIVLFARLANVVDASVTNSYRSFTAASAMSLALAGMDREVSWVDRRTTRQQQERLAGIPATF